MHCVAIATIIVMYYRSVKPVDAIYSIIREMADPDTVR